MNNKLYVLLILFILIIFFGVLYFKNNKIKEGLITAVIENTATSTANATATVANSASTVVTSDAKDSTGCETTFTATGKTESECLKICMDDNNETNNCLFKKCYGICSDCKDIETCPWLKKMENNSTRGCPFNANNSYFETKLDCKSKCKENNESSCSENVCNNLCDRCTDFTKCIWLKDVIKNKKLLREISPPSKPKVTAVPFDKKIKIRWSIDDNGGSNITKILLIVFKNNDPTGGMRIEKIFQQDPNGGSQDYLIENLENGLEYTITLCAANEIRGLGPLSNPIVLTPFKFVDAIIEPAIDSDRQSEIIEIEKNKLIDRIKKNIQSQEFSTIKQDIQKVNQIQQALFSESNKESDDYIDFLSSKKLKVMIS